MVRKLSKGIYTPLPTFFHADSEEIDIETFQKHVKYTASAGTIPVVSGTAGEAPHLSHKERFNLISAARTALDEVGLDHVPVMAGIGAPSTRESILLAKEAAQAGADAVLAITPGYYAGTLTSNSEAIKNFFIDIAKESPIPVMMYNFPAVSGGIDLDSDTIIAIAKAAPNICGVKLTCANVGKLTRITATVKSPSFQALYPRPTSDTDFMVIDGFIDFLLPSMSSGSSGAITGLANIAPRTCVRLWECCTADPGSELYYEAQKLQDLVSLADGVQLKIGIPGMKAVLQQLFGYSPLPRRPMLPLEAENGMDILNLDVIRDLIAMEQDLS